MGTAARGPILVDHDNDILRTRLKPDAGRPGTSTAATEEAFRPRLVAVPPCGQTEGAPLAPPPHLGLSGRNARATGPVSDPSPS